MVLANYNHLSFYNYSDLKDGEYQGLSVKYFTFESILKNSATLKVYLYIFKEAGNITNDDENLAVAEGKSFVNRFCFATFTHGRIQRGTGGPDPNPAGKS